MARTRTRPDPEANVGRRLDYGDGYEFRITTVCDPTRSKVLHSTLGDLLLNGTVVRRHITQREARRIQQDAVK